MNKFEKNDDFWLNRNIVMGIFFGFAILGGILSYLATNIDEIIDKLSLSILSYIVIGVAFAVLNKGSSAKTEKRIRQIERKLDKILEHRDDVLQNE